MKKLLNFIVLATFGAAACVAAPVIQTGAVVTPGGIPLQVLPGTIFSQACNLGVGGIVGQTYTDGLCSLPGTGGGGGGGGGTLSATATSAAPTYTDGNPAAPFSLNLSGDLRTIAKQSGAWSVGLTGTLPAFAATPTFNIGTAPATLATSANQLSVLAALGTPTDPRATTYDSTASSVMAQVKAMNYNIAALNDALTGATSTDPSPVSSSPVIVGASFTRPADVLPYAVGDIVGPSTAANCGGAVVAGTNGGMNGCAVYMVAARNLTGTGAGITGTIVGARLSRSAANVQSYRISYYRTAPTAVGGDNSAYAGSVNIVGAVQFCTIDITTDEVGSDGSKGEASPARNVCVFTTTTGGQIFAIVRTLTAYTPDSASTVTLATEIIQD